MPSRRHPRPSSYSSAHCNSRGRECALFSLQADMRGGGMLRAAGVRGAWSTSKPILATPRLGGGSGFPSSWAGACARSRACAAPCKHGTAHQASGGSRTLQRRPCMSSSHSRATHNRGVQALNACAGLTALAPRGAGRVHVRVNSSSCAQLRAPGRPLGPLAPYDEHTCSIAPGKLAGAGASDEIRTRQRGRGEVGGRTGYGQEQHELGGPGVECDGENKRRT